MIEVVNDWSAAWAGVMWAVLWQSTLLAVLVALVAFLCRRLSPGVRYWLWQVVAIKLLVMPFWTMAVAAPWLVGADRGQSMEELNPREFPSAGIGDLSPVPGGSEGLKRGTNLPAPPSKPYWFASIGWQAWLLVIWLVYVTWQVVTIIRQRVSLGRLLAGAKDTKDAALEGMVGELAQMIGLRRAPSAKEVDGANSPFVCGSLRPVLVLPRSMMASLDAKRLRQVLLHELAHVKRRDLAWGWIPQVVRLLYFFHPVAHWICYRIHLERELACDQIAMTGSSRDAADYADTLIQVIGHSLGESSSNGNGGAAVGLTAA